MIQTIAYIKFSNRISFHNLTVFIIDYNFSARQAYKVMCNFKFNSNDCFLNNNCLIFSMIGMSINVTKAYKR